MDGVTTGRRVSHSTAGGAVVEGVIERIDWAPARDRALVTIRQDDGVTVELVAPKGSDLFAQAVLFPVAS